MLFFVWAAFDAVHHFPSEFLLGLFAIFLSTVTQRSPPRCLWFYTSHASLAFHSVSHLFVQHLLRSSDLCYSSHSFCVCLHLLNVCISRPLCGILFVLWIRSSNTSGHRTDKVTTVFNIIVTVFCMMLAAHTQNEWFIYHVLFCCCRNLFCTQYKSNNIIQTRRIWGPLIVQLIFSWRSTIL